MPFPSPPWQLRGDAWLSVFPVRSSGTTDHPPGLYGAAFVDYGQGSVLTYRELLVARLVHDGAVPGAVPRVTVTDLWVDSATSRQAGRALWAIPKELADLQVRERRSGPAARTTWSAGLERRPFAAAGFLGVPGAAVRAPFRLTTAQERASGARVVTTVRGSAKAAPYLAGWRFAPDGPLSWLHGRRPVASFRLSGFRLTFGG